MATAPASAWLIPEHLQSLPVDLTNPHSFLFSHRLDLESLDVDKLIWRVGDHGEAPKFGEGLGFSTFPRAGPQYPISLSTALGV